MAVYKHKRKDKSGKRVWTGRWIWEVGSGKNRERGYANTLEEAVACEDDARHRIRSGKTSPERRAYTTVQEAVTRYIENLHPSLHPATRRERLRVVTQFAEDYGTKEIRSISSAECLEFLEKHSKLKKRTSRLPYGMMTRGGPEYVVEVEAVPANRKKHNRWRTVLFNFFQYCRPAYALGPQWNPLEEVVRYKKKDLDKFTKEPISTEELNRLLATTLTEGERVGVGRQYYNLIIAYAFTGARKEEVLSWTWEQHVDFKANRVLLVSAKGGEREDWIPIQPPLRKALQWQLDNKLRQSDYVFQIRGPSWEGTKKYGQRIKYANTFLKRLTKLADIRNGDNKLKKITYHTFRHYYCTQLGNKVGSGLNIAEATRLSRHWTKEIFHDVYVHEEKPVDDAMNIALGDIEVVE